MAGRLHFACNGGGNFSRQTIHTSTLPSRLSRFLAFGGRSVTGMLRNASK